MTLTKRVIRILALPIMLIGLFFYTIAIALGLWLKHFTQMAIWLINRLGEE